MCDVDGTFGTLLRTEVVSSRPYTEKSENAATICCVDTSRAIVRQESNRDIWLRVTVVPKKRTVQVDTSDLLCKGDP